MTSFFSWNMRGFNQPRKHNAVRNWVSTVRLSFGSLIETRVQESHSEAILGSTFPDWSYVTNYDHHRLGRIWVVWSRDVMITPLLKSSQHITSLIQVLASGMKFVCSFVYASNFANERRQLWGDMCYVHSHLLSPATPWLVVGDFNKVLSITDHPRGSDYSLNISGMRDFQNVASFCNLMDISSSGPSYTWINNQDSNPIGKKLDRALINPEWLNSFPQSYASFEAGGISDHSRCVIHLRPPNADHRKPFRFFNFMAGHPLFLPTVAQVWTETSPLYHSRVTLSLFHKKLKSLKSSLRALNRTQFGNLPLQTAEAYAQFCSLQQVAFDDPTPGNVEAVSVASENWQRFALLEEQIFKQKSRVNWLSCGDQNTAYFHKVAQANSSRNAIRQLTTENGTVLSQPEDIKTEAAKHFQTFLKQR